MKKTTLAFHQITHRTFAYILLFSNLLLPIGLHRPWMRQPGWWAYPATFSLAFIALYIHVVHHSGVWRILALPYYGLFLIDALSMFAWPWPMAGAPETTRKTN